MVNILYLVGSISFCIVVQVWISVGDHVVDPQDMDALTNEPQQ